jgi:hypothetical protein
VIDRDEMRRVIVSLTEGWRDADAVAADMLRPPRERELGPVLHAQNYTDARGKIVGAIAYLASLTRDDGGEPGGPDGNGGAGPTH